MDERELTEPVDLCVDGRLNPAARGWSRFPRMRANLTGSWGRKKRWDFWAVTTPELSFSMTYSNVDYAGTAGCWVMDRSDGRQTWTGTFAPFGIGFTLPEQVCTGRVSVNVPWFRLSIDEHDDRTDLSARTRSRHGLVSVDVSVAKPADHESLNVVIPFDGDAGRRFQFTSKQNTRAVTGSVSVGDRHYTLGGEDAYAVQDLGRGIWPYENNWNWGYGSGRATDGRLIGLQFGGKWTVGTGATENALCIDGRLFKISEELEWDYSWDRPKDPWRIHGSGIDVTLAPYAEKSQDTNLAVVKMQVRQAFGRWTGTIPDGDGGTITIEDLDGSAEEARIRW